MQWLTVLLAVYGAALSTVLAAGAIRRERHRVHFWARFVRSSSGNRLEITVLNDGHRPISLESAHFATSDGGGYLFTADSALGLPCRLEEGETLPMTFPAEDISPETVAFVVRSYKREHRHNFNSHIQRSFNSHPHT